jgi:V-type H+-transporting ATPase subunit G
VYLLEEELNLVFEAEKRAKEILVEAERTSARIKNEMRSESDQVMNQSQEGARQEGDNIISRRVSEAEQERGELEATQKGRISEMDQRATERKREAVDLILKSITEGK